MTGVRKTSAKVSAVETSGPDPDLSTAAPQKFACEPYSPPFGQQPQYKTVRKGASTFLQSRVVQLRKARSTSALSPVAH